MSCSICHIEAVARDQSETSLRLLLRPQGAFPRLLLPSEGWVYRPAPKAPLIMECQRGRRHFLGMRARVGYGPVPGPTKKSLVPHLSVRWGVLKILLSTSTSLKSVSLLLKYILTLSLILCSY